MSNVIKLFDHECEDCTVTPPAEIGIEGFRSLFESWSSITLSLRQLQEYLDELRPILGALPDGPEKALAWSLMTESAIQIRDSVARSIEASTAVAPSRYLRPDDKP
jgi:hypothetical protein